MHAKADKGKYVCPECRTKIPMDDLEAVFREQVQALVTSPAQIALYAAQADESLHLRQELMEQKEGECRTVAAEMEKLYRLYMEDGISVEDFRKRYRSLEERHKQIETELPRLQAELDVLKIHYLSRDEVISQAADLYSNWSKLPHEERRAIVEAIAEKIVVADDAIEINLCYLMPPEMAAIGQRGTAAASSPSSKIPTATRSS
jgi:hypothetical protein